jgi:hypothetical protein
LAGNYFSLPLKKIDFVPLDSPWTCFPVSRVLAHIFNEAVAAMIEADAPVGGVNCGLEEISGGAGEEAL